MDFYKKVASKKIIDTYLNNKAVVLIEWIENFKEVFNQELIIDLSVYIQYLKDKEGNILENERQIIIKYM